MQVVKLGDFIFGQSQPNNIKWYGKIKLNLGCYRIYSWIK